MDCSAVPCVALTFDDGPGEHTSRLLDILAAHEVPATFYTVGRQVEKRPDVIRRMKAAGHQIGNHTYDHPQLTTVSADEVRSQIARTDALLRAQGVTPSTVRPPYGSYNTTVLQVLGSLGHGAVNWNVDPQDWQLRHTPTVVQRVTSAASPGAILLLHDVHPTSVDAVPEIIRTLKARGYHFVTVDQITGGVAPGTLVHRGVRP